MNGLQLTNYLDQKILHPNGKDQHNTTKHKNKINVIQKIHQQMKSRLTKVKTKIIQNHEQLQNVKQSQHRKSRNLGLGISFIGGSNQEQIKRSISFYSEDRVVKNKISSDKNIRTIDKPIRTKDKKNTYTDGQSSQHNVRKSKPYINPFQCVSQQQKIVTEMNKIMQSNTLTLHQQTDEFVSKYKHMLIVQ